MSGQVHLRRPATVPAAAFMLALALAALAQAAPASRAADVERALEEIYLEYRDVPYDYGGCDKRGIDCSCFVQRHVLDLFDTRIPRATWEQGEVLPIEPVSGVRTVASLDAETLCPGDLVYTYRGASWRRGPRHVAFYAGGGRILHAALGVGVAFQPLRVLDHHRLQGVVRLGSCAAADREPLDLGGSATEVTVGFEAPPPAPRDPAAEAVKADADYVAELEGGRLLLDLIAAEGDLRFAYTRDPQSILLTHYHRRFWFEKDRNLVVKVARMIVESIKPESEFLYHPEPSSGLTYRALIDSLSPP
ncbi:MAG: NlpC/P60 family protein [Acidobacteriota bacterium]